MKMCTAVILAAGKGTRMRSLLPKPLVPLKGKPIVQHIIEAFKKAGITEVCLIIGHEADKIKHAFGNKVQYAVQKEQKGTAHAVLQAKDIIDWKDKHVFVFVGDSPLISSETILKLKKHHTSSDASCTFLTALFPVSLPYARVIKNEKGDLLRCVEEKNASPAELSIRELLSSHFIFKGNDLFHFLHEIKPDKDNQEFYLTDMINILLSKKLKVETLCIDNYTELIGLNTPEEVLWAEKLSDHHS